MTALVFENTQGNLEDLNGETVGVIRLDLDDPDSDLLASMQFLSEVTAWEAGSERGTTTLAFATEAVSDARSAGVVRYASTPPSFDEVVTNVNAVVFYSTDGGTDETDELLFVLMVEDGPGFAGWTPNEPAEGLARVRADATLGDLTLDDLIDVNTAGVATGDALVWNGSAWVPGIPGSWGEYAVIDGLPAPSGTPAWVDLTDFGLPAIQAARDSNGMVNIYGSSIFLQMVEGVPAPATITPTYRGGSAVIDSSPFLTPLCEQLYPLTILTCETTMGMEGPEFGDFSPGWALLTHAGGLVVGMADPSHNTFNISGTYPGAPLP